MHKFMRPIVVVALTAVTALVVAACGSSSSSSTSTAGKNGGTVTIAAGTAPLSPDQGYDFTTQGTELYSVVATPLLTFRRGVQGTASEQILPALAQSLPKISGGGTVYTLYLRPGLKYSNGAPVMASDFTHAIERDLKIPWIADSFLTSFIKGAAAYAAPHSKLTTISGIKTNNATREIQITLTKPFAPFEDVLALSGTAPVPASTPFKNLTSTGTIGDGPYKWGPISVGHSYTLIKNTSFSGVPTVPKGHAAKIVFNVNSNVLTDAENVLNNSADVFDPGDTIPPTVLPSVSSKARGRYQQIPTNSTFYFFFNVTKKPFNNLYARKAVLAALDLRALSRYDSGFLTEDCHLIPDGITGHSTPSNCASLTGHAADGPPNMSLAMSYMKKSGMKGQPVTVWGETRSPRAQYATYFASVLDKLGFKATPKLINSGVYFGVIGAPSTKPQAGFADWIQDFPNPFDFMQLFTAAGIPSENYGYVNDPHYNSEVNKLEGKPLAAVASQWAALDDYAVSKGYYAAFGHESFPKFESSSMLYSAPSFSLEYELDLTSLELAK